MRWVKTNGMPLKPYCCAGCGSTGEMGEDGPPPAYFREGVDINWGDSLYICDTCCRILGELRGMADVDKVQALESAVTQWKDKYDTVKRNLDEAQNRIDRMLDGVKAKKEAQKARPKKKVAA